MTGTNSKHTARPKNTSAGPQRGDDGNRNST